MPKDIHTDCKSYGDMQAAADIANRVFHANATPMILGLVLLKEMSRAGALESEVLL